MQYLVSDTYSVLYESEFLRSQHLESTAVNAPYLDKSLI